MNDDLALVAAVLADRLHGLEPSSVLLTELRARAPIRWEGVIARAGHHFVLPAFAAALRDLGLLGALEPQVRAALEFAIVANVGRNRSLRDQLLAAISTLNDAGIEPVLLKGAIRLVDGLYPGFGWRVMRDLDLLVPESKLGDAVNALREDGYGLVAAPSERAWQHHHYPGLARAGCVACVELHTELFSTSRRRRLLRGAEVLRAARAVEVYGARARVPSANHQMTHLIGHCQNSGRYRSAGAAPLRDLLEAAALDAYSTERVAWQEVRGRFANAGYRVPLTSFLLSMESAGFSPAAGVAESGALAWLWRGVPGAGAGPAAIRRVRRRVSHWATLVGELMLDPEMRRKALRRSADAILRRQSDGTTVRPSFAANGADGATKGRHASR